MSKCRRYRLTVTAETVLEKKIITICLIPRDQNASDHVENFGSFVVSKES